MKLKDKEAIVVGLAQTIGKTVAFTWNDSSHAAGESLNLSSGLVMH